MHDKAQVDLVSIDSDEKGFRSLNIVRLHEITGSV